MSPVSIPPSGRDACADRASEGAADTPFDMQRRDALKLLASGVALSLAGCAPPDEEIVPYVDMPEGLVAGEPEYYATALPLAGYARGAIVEAVDGRPLKVAGNPRHPASLGSTDIFAEAEILGLYDPDRSRTVSGSHAIATWNTYLRALLPRMETVKTTGGDGLRLVTGRVTSPTLLRQIAAFLQRYPQARWHAYEPAEGDLADAGVRTRRKPRLAEADVIVSLDADPLGAGPDQIVNARAFAAGRDTAARQTVSRLYAIESTRTLTGANADHRLVLAPKHIEAVADALAARIDAGERGGSGTGRDGAPQNLPDRAARVFEAIADDIARAGNRALILAGPTLSPAAHRKIDALNVHLGAPVDVGDEGNGGPVPTAMDDLFTALKGGRVSDLVVLDRNPVYDFPDPDLHGAIRGVAFSVHAGTHATETAKTCRWHLPLAHILESWSDLASTGGTVAIVQPLIRPLYATRSAHEIMGHLLGDPEPDGYDIVRETWKTARAGVTLDSWWREALLAGVVEGGAPKGAMGDIATARAPASSPKQQEGVVAVIRPDPSVYDGTHANNAWLQECPRPIAKHTWSNAVSMSPNMADGLGVRNGDVVMVQSQGGRIYGSVHVDAGTADEVVGLTLGYGREAGGTICAGLGYNARALTPLAFASVVSGVSVMPTGDRRPVASTQDQFKLEGDFEKLFPVVTGESGYAVEPPKTQRKDQQSFFHPDRGGEYQWGMVIDSAACIGCNACVIACQAENNIAVVGPGEVANSRIMHWLRIDRYERGDGPDAAGGFEPVPCMQCEQAPCEPVCPVEASVHDSEGLNDQVYNRCVGTRFCQSNCPYKVRRFNWYAYGSGQEYKNLGADPIPASKNPDVSVRARGVMEKCTYCVQRISRARRGAEKTDTRIGDGDVVTACQQACPTQAITFGDLRDEKSHVRVKKQNPRHFTLLEELATGPRTTYLARVRNANSALDEDKSGEGSG